MLNVYTFALFFIFLCMVFENDRSVLKLNLISNKLIFFMLSIYLVLLAGLRYGIETDYWSYHRIFNSVTSKHNLDDLEKGFLTLIKFYKTFLQSENFNGFIFMIALLSVGLKASYISKLKEPFIAFLFYFVGSYIMYEFNTIRQGTAICFLFFAAEQIEKKNFWKFIIWAFVAFLFHSSSILFLLAWFFCKIRMSERKILALIILSVFLSVFAISLAELFFHTIPLPGNVGGFLSRIFTYLKWAQKGKLFSFGFFRRIVSIILLYFILGREGIRSPFFKIFFLGSLLYTVFMRSDVIANRLSGSFEIFIIPLVGCGSRKRNFTATTCLFTLILLYIALFFVSLNNGNALPYQTYLFMESVK